VSIAAECDEASCDERRIVDRRLVADLEVAEQPSRRDSRVPARLQLGDQDRQLEELAEGRTAEGAKRRLGDRKVSPLDRSVEDGPRMALSARGAFPGPDGRASLTLSATWSP
jgi:hypothetical protein